MKILLTLKKTKTWIWVIGVFLIIWNFVKLFALLGPPIYFYLISSLSVWEFIISSYLLFQEGLKRLGIERSALMAMTGYSCLMATLFLVVTPFLLKNRSWAHKFVLVLLGTEIFKMVALSVYYKTLPSVDILIIYIASFLFLLRPSVVLMFNKPHNPRLYSDER